MRTRMLVTVVLVSVWSYAAVADVRTEQKTQVQFAGMLGRMVNLFGGKAAREGVTSTVIVKGDRKVTVGDSTSQIVDLAEEKIYDLDLRRKTYRVTTFDELRRQMEEARRRAEADARRQEPQEPREEAPKSDEPQREVEVDFEVRRTGESKVINGFDTTQTQMIITVREKGRTLEESGGLVLTTDVWLAPEQPAMRELETFERRYAEKLYGGLTGVSADQMAAVMAMYPMLKPALDRMASEGDKFEGTAILTTVRAEAVRSAEQMAAEAKEREEPQPQAGRGVGGIIGGLAARRIRKTDDEPRQRTVFMTTTTELLKLSTNVSDAEVAVPAGFREAK